MGIRVLKGGMMTTVQDLGRTGYQSQGFSVSGVMDVRSFKIANLLLDNPENEAVLEFTLIGPTLEFTSETIIQSQVEISARRSMETCQDVYSNLYASWRYFDIWRSKNWNKRIYCIFKLS